jgi:energy-coupling factor transporter ATP-binding protein EcfA2
LIADNGTPILLLAPLIQILAPLPGHRDEVFMLAGPGRTGARLLSVPHEFEHHDDDLWDWFRSCLLDEDAIDQAFADDPPFRGLTAFTSEDAVWFFGRERESEFIVNRLRKEPFVAVVGPSGVGKSSLVQAGVIPAVAGWRVVTMRPGRAPLSHLATLLEQAGVDPPRTHLGAIENQVGQAWRAPIERWASGSKGVVLFVDQFEELFTLGCSQPEREQVIGILMALVAPPIASVRVVITLRDDFLIRAEQLGGLGDALARGLHLLGPLSPTALHRIITEPAARAGYQFEDPELPARMVVAVANSRAAVALVSFTASRLWDLRDRHFRRLGSKAYDALGGVGGALARHADETVSALPSAQRALVADLFCHLVTSEGTRAVLRRTELVQLIGDGANAQHLVERLLEARLITTAEDIRGQAAIEIVHEALLEAWPQLSEWRRLDLEGARFHEQLRSAARQWDDRGRVRGLLWRGDAVAELQLWRKRRPVHLTPLEGQFAAASLADTTRGRVVARVGIGLALIAALGFASLQWRARRREQALQRETAHLRLGAVGSFDNSCHPRVRADLVRGVALLHSFFYEEARRIFAGVAARDPRCGIADWGVAMTWYHPLWSPPTDEEMQSGLAAVTAAEAVGAGSALERDYIAAIAAFYRDAPAPAAGEDAGHGATGGHPARARAYAGAMERVYRKYRQDSDAAAFYALALLGAAPPADPELINQRAAAQILEGLWRRNRYHPGFAHYLIYAYDYPSLAGRGLEPATAYADMAPWVPHALHIPSHIFTRLGRWEDSVQTNLASAQAAREYAAQHHPDAASFEELHALDYLVYAYLQTGQDGKAKEIVDRVVAMRKTHPEFDVAAAYALGAIPARYALERHAWREAAALAVLPSPLFARFPFAEAHLEYAHALGRARSGDLPGARRALDRTRQLRDANTDPRFQYFQQQLDLQYQAASAWLSHAEGKDGAAVDLLRKVADAEDLLGKHPVSPGAIFPVRELLAELLLELGRPEQALVEYERSLIISPGRRNALTGDIRARALLTRRGQ